VAVDVAVTVAREVLGRGNEPTVLVAADLRGREPARLRRRHAVGAHAEDGVVRNRDDIDARAEGPVVADAPRLLRAAGRDAVGETLVAGKPDAARVGEVLSARAERVAHATLQIAADQRRGHAGDGARGHRVVVAGRGPRRHAGQAVQDADAQLERPPGSRVGAASVDAGQDEDPLGELLRGCQAGQLRVDPTQGAFR
jgi:hypothetical protein